MITAPWKKLLFSLSFTLLWKNCICSMLMCEWAIQYRYTFLFFLHDTSVTQKKCTQTHSKRILLNETLLFSRSPVERNTTEQCLLNATDLSLSYFVFLLLSDPLVLLSFESLDFLLVTFIKCFFFFSVWYLTLYKMLTKNSLKWKPNKNK